MARADELVTTLLDEAGVVSPPIPVAELARRRGARLVYQPLDGDAWGLLFRAEARLVLGVNSAQSKQKQDFVIAHELGHLLLHEGRQLIIDKNLRLDARDPRSSQASDKQEREANEFAGALLMPAAMLRTECERLLQQGVTLDDAVIERLANTFDVSSRGMGYRLLNLGFSLLA